MEHGVYNIIYFDTRARANRIVRVTDREELHPGAGTVLKYEGLGDLDLEEEVKNNIELLLSVFPEVSVSRSASHCILSLQRPEKSHSLATIIFMHIPPAGSQLYKERPRDTRTPSPRSKDGSAHFAQAERLNGPQFLWQLGTEANAQTIPKPVIPVVLLGGTVKINPGPPNKLKNFSVGQPSNLNEAWKDEIHLTSLLDAGAVDVLESPLSRQRLQSVLAQAYRETRRDRTKSSPSFEPLSRKTSWMGTPESKPFSYLRETMVSGLMYRICNPDHPEEQIDPRALDVSTSRKETIKQAVGCWEFSAHEFNDDELLYGALLILRHTLRIPELAKYQIHSDEIIKFLKVCRSVYNSFVIYHNFRHACDVMQAAFVFLMSIGTIPPLTTQSPRPSSLGQTPIASILTPFHGLLLLISAIGHDVGHPGVNNMFLVKLNAPLAQLYNDRSVLESFHCAAFSQILRRYWSVAFADAQMRKLMINSILATDMGLHSQYTTRLSDLTKSLAENKKTIEGWTPAAIEENKDLLCCLLIKCADICNVARKFPIATQWARILTDEFSHQGAMEKELKMPTCLFGGPPVQNDVIKMGESQISFMSIFAAPLFGAMTQILPDMKFTSETIEENRLIWNATIEAAKAKKLSSIDTAIAKHQQVIKSAPPNAATSPLRLSMSEPAAPSTVSPAPATSALPAAKIISPQFAESGQNIAQSGNNDLSPHHSHHSSLDPHPGASTQFLESNLTGSNANLASQAIFSRREPSSQSFTNSRAPAVNGYSDTNGDVDSSLEEERKAQAVGSPRYDNSAGTLSHVPEFNHVEQLASESGAAMSQPDITTSSKVPKAQVNKSQSLADFKTAQRRARSPTRKDKKKKTWKFWQKSKSPEREKFTMMATES